jgi:hypothetical protein
VEQTSDRVFYHAARRMARRNDGLKRKNERVRHFPTRSQREMTHRLVQSSEVQVLRRFRRSDGLAQNGEKGMKRDCRQEPENSQVLGGKPVQAC